MNAQKSDYVKTKKENKKSSRKSKAAKQDRQLAPRQSNTNFSEPKSSATAPAALSEEEQLERFADFLLDIYLTSHCVNLST